MIGSRSKWRMSGITSVTTLKILKNLDGPIENPRKPRSNFYTIARNLRKKSNFSQKTPTFSKKCLLSAKIPDDFF